MHRGGSYPPASTELTVTSARGAGVAEFSLSNGMKVQLGILKRKSRRREAEYANMGGFPCGFWNYREWNLDESLYRGLCLLLRWRPLWWNVPRVLVCVRFPWRSTWRTVCWSAPCRTCCGTMTTTMTATSACTNSTQHSVSSEPICFIFSISRSDAWRNKAGDLSSKSVLEPVLQPQINT